MNKSIRVMGFDPSMRNWGVAVADLDLETMELKVSDLELIETKSEAKKNKTVRKSSLDFDRGRFLCSHVKNVVEKYQPSFIMTEMPIGSQNSSAMKSYGMVIGILACLETPIIQVQPSEVKLATVGSKTATKKEMIDWATTEHPEAKWLERGGKVVLKNEHLADSVAAIYAGMITDHFMVATEVLRKIERFS